jgi:hypothetical protein
VTVNHPRHGSEPLRTGRELLVYPGVREGGLPNLVLIWNQVSALALSQPNGLFLDAGALAEAALALQEKDGLAPLRLAANDKARCLINLTHRERLRIGNAYAPERLRRNAAFLVQNCESLMSVA